MKICNRAKKCPYSAEIICVKAEEEKMTKEEALKKIKELEEYIKELDNKTDFEDDEIFLLSIDEYEKYKSVIPHINQWWWLRSPGHYQRNVGSVFFDGSVYYGVVNDTVYVRPALRIESDDLSIGGKFVKYNSPWIKIDKNLAVAEEPIGVEIFDYSSNVYAESYIREWLLDWLKGRR